MTKAFTLGFVVGIALLFVSGVAGVQKDSNKTYQEEDKLYQKEIGDATPILLQVMTEKQRFHSKLHNGASSYVDNKTISEMIAEYRGKKTVLGRFVNGRRFIPENPETAKEFFTRLAEESDVVLRGKAIKKISQITDDEAFLFTDYDVTVTEVLKNSTSTSISPETSITVTCLGGKIVVDHVILVAGGNGFPTLPIDSYEVLLFLKLIPETGSYELTHYNGSFELDGTLVRPLAGQLPVEFNKDQHSFLKVVRAAVRN
jgi:hypothetical protein